MNKKETPVRTSFNSNLILEVLSVVMVSTSVVVPQVYLAQNPQINLDITNFVEAVLVPIALASIVFLGRGQRIFWLAFMGYIWSLTEDSPVYLDSVFTWPEVTSGFQHLALEVVFHILTFIFIFLTIREAFKVGKKQNLVHRKASVNQTSNQSLLKLLAFSLGLSAFILSYAQNLPTDFFETMSGTSWYLLDSVEHIFSILLLYAAVKLALMRR